MLPVDLVKKSNQCARKNTKNFVDGFRVMEKILRF